MGGWGLCKKDLKEISPSGEPRTAAKKGEKIKEGGVKNKITINPNVQVESQQIDEIDNLGGKTAVATIIGSGLGMAKSAYAGISSFIKNRRQKTQQQNNLINNIQSRNEEEIKISRKDYKKIHKDFKSDDPKNPRTTKYVQGKGTVSMPVKFTDEYQPKEGENIDELSKKTLANYTRKSATSLAKHSMEFGSKPNKKDSKKLEKRHSGIMKAASKLANESLLDQIANAYVEEATRMKKEMGYDKGGTKKPTGPKAKDAALDAIKAKYKGQIMRTGSKQEKKVKGAKPSGGGKFKMMAVKKKETETAAKKAGYKNTQDYVNVQAVRKGGLGT